MKRPTFEKEVSFVLEKLSRHHETTSQLLIASIQDIITKTVNEAFLAGIKFERDRSAALRLKTSNKNKPI